MSKSSALVGKQISIKTLLHRRILEELAKDRANSLAD